MELNELPIMFINKKNKSNISPKAIKKKVEILNDELKKLKNCELKYVKKKKQVIFKLEYKIDIYYLMKEFDIDKKEAKKLIKSDFGKEYSVLKFNSMFKKIKYILDLIYDPKYNNLLTLENKILAEFKKGEIIVNKKKHCFNCSFQFIIDPNKLMKIDIKNLVFELNFYKFIIDKKFNGY